MRGFRTLYVISDNCFSPNPFHTDGKLFLSD